MPNAPHSASPRRAPLRTLIAAATAVMLTACANIRPVPLNAQDLQPVNVSDRSAMVQDVEPLSGPLTLEEAQARALKYNLERRAKLMEEALALRQLDVTQLDMLPKLVAQAGYGWRNNDRISQSRNAENGDLSPSRFISQERTHALSDLTVSWSLLDYGLGRVAAHQQADRVLIAGERRRKAMHVLMQDVRTAYWRAASAQKLRDDVARTITMAEEALDDSRKAESERLRNPIDALRYQRQVLENLRLLEAINQELASANIELGTLINAPIGGTIRIADVDQATTTPRTLELDIGTMEELALQQNADLREQHYNGRVAREEVRRTLVRLFPNISLNYGYKYDSDRYLVHNDWQEAGVQMSFNLFNLLTADTQMKLARAGVALAEQRRVATQMAVVTQVHLARLQLVNAHKQFVRADAIYLTDQKITEHTRNREQALAQSKLDRVSNEVSTILSLLRRYQALAQVQAAESRLLASIGAEPAIGSTDDVSLPELVQQIRRGTDMSLRSQPAQTVKVGS
ncbi:transporter [Aquabacterium olei]|uniref:Transporter n=1 Tax=Aquabacterium olei TaxID=1296669 RepID=A0A2U8FPP5_9BURK|nr:TolC family protein [Aquabacterium olei]AWI52818.1 transporter [Aquabacterium olei]